MSSKLTYEELEQRVKELEKEIAKHKQVEETLRESEKKHRSIFENAVEGIFQTSPDGTYISVNPALARIYGYDSQEQLIRMLTNIEKQLYVDPNRRAEFMHLMEKHDAGTNFESQVYRKDGSIIWISENARAVRDENGHLLYYEGFVEDITERKRAEEERVRLATAIEQAAESVIITDADRVIQYVNPAFERISGYNQEEVIGGQIELIWSSEHSQEFYNVLRDHLDRGEVWSGHIINRKKDGTLFETETTISPIRDSRGNITNYVNIKRDVTHEIQLERQLRQAQKMEAIGTLAGGIAHDFNNILAAIIGYVELALLDIPQEHSARQKLDQVLKASRRAKDLVRQILAFSRQSDQERKPVEPGLIVKEALKLLRSSLPTTIEIRQNIESDTGTVEADPTQLHQVLMNLCTNAAHAMGENGGVLEVTLSKVDVEAGAAALHPDIDPGTYLKLTVSDTGHGMTPDVMERIFDPYFTTKEKSEGTGLGLAVVHGIVKSHGGAVTVDSIPGRGSIFNVYLPRIEREVTAEPEASEHLPKGNERILFIDDEPALVEVGKQMLEHLGYEVITRTSSIEALELFRTQPDRFDLVITDMTMPQMTGKQLAKELMHIRPDIPVILRTGFSERITEEKAKEMGIRAFVMKPLVIHDFAVTIRKVLDKKS